MILAVAAILYLTLPARAQSPPDPHTPENPIIRFYQTHISRADGNRCPMYPSCSHYTAQALKTHGPVMGWIMACDRLLRCGRSETRLSHQVRAHGRTLTFDPLEANDFWWFTSRPDPEGQ